MNVNIEDNITAHARQLSVDIRGAIAQLRQRKQEHVMKVFERYISVFHPHFIVWLYGMQSSCITADGKYAAADNAHLELKDDHQMMLFEFMKQLNVEPNIQTYKQLLPQIKGVNRVMHFGVKNRKGAGPSMVIYLLEKSSEVFIPWMDEIAQRHHVKNRVYTETHGIAYLKHSGLAKAAVLSEYKASKDIPLHIDKAYEATSALLLHIFSEE
jgi:hypothetical protein